MSLVQAVCEVPIALVSLVDADRQWFKAKRGVDVSQTALDTSVCALAIEQRGVFQIEDLSADARTAGMALVTGGPCIRFYAGAPLVASNGDALGSLCAIDVSPRPGGLTAPQAEALRLLADQVVDLIEARQAIMVRDQALALDEARRRSEKLEERYQAIVDSAIDNAIIAMDADGNVTSWSKGAERIFGWSEAEMIGQPADRFFTPEDRAAGVPDREFNGARAAGRASDERWHLRKDGSRFFAHGAMTPLRGTEAAGFVKAVRDITAEHETKAALESARGRAAMMTHAARLGTFDYDLTSGDLAWDEGCRALFGLSPDANVTYEGAFLRGLHPDDRAGADAAVASALDPEGDGVFETEYRTVGIADGRLRFVAARGQAFFADGRALRLLGTVQDVTEARLAERRLRETEQRLRFANRATNDPIWDWDLVADQVTWNEAIRTCFGHSLDTVNPSGAWWLDHIHPEDRERIATSIHAVIDHGHIDWSDDYRFRRADGSYADVRDRGYVIRDDEGRPLRMIGAMLDQSDRVRTERTLRDEAVVLAGEVERLWTASPDLLVVMASDGTYRRVNPAWGTILGYDEDELVGAAATALSHPDESRATEGALVTAQQGDLSSFSQKVRHKDGSYRLIDWAAATRDDEIFAIGRDITEKRAAENTLRQTEEALRQSQKVEAVGQLTGGVAHDFNNLLTVIRGSVDLLRRPNISDERRARYIDAIADTTDRATKLTGQLLAFARRQALKPEVIDASHHIDALQDMLRTLTGSRIETRYDLLAEPALVLADPSQFDTAIVNMAVNGRDAMDSEGTLTIAVRLVDRVPAVRAHPPVDGAHVAISITDTGSGIPAERIGQIFEPFFTTKGVGHGTGLGLSQVIGFAKQSSGDVAVSSEVGAGAVFTLYLPVAAPDPQRSAVSVAPTRNLRAGSCILIVEDNKDVGEFATQALAELGHQSLWVSDADAALVELGVAPDRFDVVFTDVVMPGRSGIELAEEVTRLFPALPVVLTSGYSHILAEKGSSGYELLRKPYSLDELSGALARVTAR
ncbi:PAS domain S-box protein [Sphingomonas sp. RHCKR7]|nr:PAS domain S-box protein [Sphingomonas folli]